MTDKYMNMPAGLTGPLENGFSVTPHDTNALTAVTREIYVGTSGDIALTLKSGDEITLTNVPGGSRLPYRATIIKSTGTTASGIVGLY